MAQNNWKDEHGSEYDVPAIVLKTLVDCSWKNDVCPSFVRDCDLEGDENPIRLWVDHPAPALREHADAPRYMVSTGCDEPLYEGDVLADALKILHPDDCACSCCRYDRSSR